MASWSTQELMTPVGEVRHGRAGEVLLPPGGEIQQQDAGIEVDIVGPAPVPGPVGHAVERGDVGRARVGDAEGGEVTDRRVEQLADAAPGDEVGVEVQGPVYAGRQHVGDEQPCVGGPGDAGHSLGKMLDLLPEPLHPVQPDLGVGRGRLDLFPVQRGDPHVTQVQVQPAPGAQLGDDRPDRRGQWPAEAVVGGQDRGDPAVGHANLPRWS